MPKGAGGTGWESKSRISSSLAGSETLEPAGGGFLYSPEGWEGSRTRRRSAPPVSSRAGTERP